MSTNPPLYASRGLQVLKIALYILAGLILALGLAAGISLMSGSHAIATNVLQPIRIMGGQGVSDLISPMLTSFLIQLGAVILLLSLIFCALFNSIGRLIGHLSHLEAHLARLEELYPQIPLVQMEEPTLQISQI
jgi:hypothetical protein